MDNVNVIYDLLAAFTDAAIYGDEHPADDEEHQVIAVFKFPREHVDLVRMALEKQMPRVPDRVAGHPACSRCGTVLCHGDAYCCRCGQRREKA